jgi:hypothetical protein
MQPDPTVTPPGGVQGAVGGQPVSGPLQLEKAWHGLMYTMAYGGVTGAKTANSAARHVRTLMRGGKV